MEEESEMRRSRVATVFGLLILSFLVAGGSTVGWSQEVEFFTFPMGARSIGMGRAYTGISDDVNAIVWNPAGLALLDRSEVFYSRLESFEFESLDGISGINNNLIAVGFPVEKYGCFGFSLEIQNYGETVITDRSGVVRGVESDRGYIFYGSYATAIFDKLDVGFDFKYLRVNFTGEGGTPRRGSTSAIDIGGLFRPLRDVPLQIGVAFRNLGFALQFEDEFQKDPLPRRLVLGVGYDLLQHLFDSDQLGLIISSDTKFRRTSFTNNEGKKITEIEKYYYNGVEVSFERTLYFRAGYIAEPERFRTSGPSFGIGFTYRGMNLDLGREFGVSELGDETHISAGYRF
jgi:hypothetical protein